MKKILIYIICFFLVNSFLSAQTKRALLVGISDYGGTDEQVDSEWSNIHGANDVELILSTLKSQSFTIKTLKDKQASAQNIRKEFALLTKKVRKGDLVYIHFSCHGQPFEDLSGDEEDGWDEAIIPVDAKKKYSTIGYQGQNHIIDDELHTFFEAIRSKAGKEGMIYVVLDACHMGSASRGEDEDEEYIRGTRDAFSPNGLKYQPRINAKGNFQILADPGKADICILEACRSYQMNREIKQDGQFYGPLSYYVNQYLKNNSLSKDTKWIEPVRKSMNSDSRLIRQNMVVESSK